MTEANNNVPRNLKEFADLLSRVVPLGFVGVFDGYYAWLEYPEGDKHCVLGLPVGSQYSEAYEWEDFDADHGPEIIESIAKWVADPKLEQQGIIAGFNPPNRIDDEMSFCAAMLSKADKNLQLVSQTSFPYTDNEEWDKWVKAMYLCVRRNDSTIPDDVLDTMRNILLAHSRK